MFSVPDTFVQETAKRQGVTQTELDALLLALANHSGIEIAKRLEISEAAVRKRLGESYKKFQIEVGGNKKLSHLKQQLLTAYQSSQPEGKHQDWGEAVDVEDFCGREAQLTELEQWILGDAVEFGSKPRRLVAVLGMGGIGKTTLAAKLAKTMQPQFDYLIWRSLLNAPPLKDILAELLKFLPSKSELDSPDNENTRLLRLLNALRDHRCLIVLDNVESILRSGQDKDHEQAGEYEEDYEGYGDFFKKVGETAHQSCLLLTSREKPKEIAALEGKELPVKVLQLAGLNQQEAREMLRNKGFSGSEAELRELVERYSGNPLALKIVATTIYDLFGNNVGQFLSQIREETAVYGDIRILLENQFNRLSRLEKQVMYWLAIDRVYVDLTELQNDIVPLQQLTRILDAVESLSRRSLIIKDGKTGKIRLSPVILEYVTEQLIDQAYAEILQLLQPKDESVDWRKFSLLNNYALSKASALDYIEGSQKQRILEPLKNKLLSVLGDELEPLLWRSIAAMKGQAFLRKKYIAGNIVRLLCQLQIGNPKINLNGSDFSDLTLWQVNFKNVSLEGTLFNDSDLTGSVFTETMMSLVSVRFSPDGTVFATGMGDGEIRLWQASDHKQIQSYKEHNVWVWTLAFSPDSQLLASGSDDHTVKLWNRQTEECTVLGEQTQDQHQNKVFSVNFSPDGKMLASASADQTIKLWDVQQNQCLRTLSGHTDGVWAVVFSPDGQTIASASADLTIKLWNVSTGDCIKTLKGHRKQVYSIAFHPDGQLLASSGEDEIVKLWEVRTGKCLKSLDGHRKKIYSIRFSPNGQLLASSGEDRTIKLWDVQTGDCLKTLTGHTSQVWSIAFSPDGGTLLSSSDDQTARLWNVDTGDLLNVLQGSTRGVYSVMFSPDSRLLASGSDDHLARLWNVKTGECRTALRGHRGRLRSVAFHPSGKILASGSGDYTIRLWEIEDLEKPKLLKTLEGHSNWVWSVMFSPDGKTLVSSSEDRTVKLWDIETGKCLRTFEGHTHWVWSAAISPDGNAIASGSADCKIKLWNVHTGDCLRTLADHKDLVWSVAFSPNGEILASGSADHTVKLWKVRRGECQMTLAEHQQQVHSVAFSPDGHLLASGSDDRTVKLWNVNTGKCLVTLRGQQKAAIYAIAFSPDGKILASGSEDETIQLWDVQRYTRLQQLRSNRIYEGMNITGVNGLTDAQKASLAAQGAVVPSD